MCGVAGFLNNVNSPKKDIVKNMIHSLKHRGPDGSGIWFDNSNNVVLGHTRLSILDLSSSANQPFSSQSGRYVISYNGEIYNHLSLRNELNKLKKIHWKTTSDTETLVELFDFWGIKKTLELVHGMFAIAVWDNVKKSLHLVRDRMGEKPLYYGYIEGSCWFASELKALKKIPFFKFEINSLALSNYIKLGYVPYPLSIYKNIYKLEPGTILSMTPNQITNKKTTYWSTLDIMASGSKNKFVGSADSGPQLS